MVNRRKLITAIASAVFFQVVFLVLDSSLCCAEPEKESTITPDPKIQELIRRVIDAPDDDKDGREAIKKLQELFDKTPEVVMPQFIYYDVHISKEKEWIGYLRLRSHINFRDSEVVRQSLIPLLELSDKKTKESVYSCLLPLDSYEQDPYKNVRYYHVTLARKKESPPPGLVEYVFSLNPSQALLFFGEIYSEKPLLGTFPRPLMWSDHVITTVKWRLRNNFLQEGDLEKAQKELDGLSKHEGWYARRYVVEVIRGSPELGTPDMIKRLKKEANPLVSEAAKMIK